uniref:Uncharacterized protein n=1 Tax=Oryza barthii TaxID=65489 RepID=A0A0D3FP70_9ORYZ
MPRARAPLLLRACGVEGSGSWLQHHTGQDSARRCRVRGYSILRRPANSTGTVDVVNVGASPNLSTSSAYAAAELTLESPHRFNLRPRDSKLLAKQELKASRCVRD